MNSMLLASTMHLSQGLPYNFSNFVFLARSYTVPSPVSSSPCSKRQRTDDTVKEKEKTETKVRGERGSCTMSSLSVLHCQEYEILQEVSTRMSLLAGPCLPEFIPHPTMNESEDEGSSVCVCTIYHKVNE